MSGITPRVGMLFEHARHLDMSWQPDVAKGERYVDAPHAVYRVTKVNDVGVFYKTPGQTGPGFYISRAAFPSVAVREVLDHHITAPTRYLSRKVST